MKMTKTNEKATVLKSYKVRTTGLAGTEKHKILRRLAYELHISYICVDFLFYIKEIIWKKDGAEGCRSPLYFSL